MSGVHNQPWTPGSGLGDDLRPTAVIGLAGLKSQVDRFALSSDHICRIAAPERFDRDHVKRIQRDFELLADIAREHPQKIVEMQMQLSTTIFTARNGLRMR